MQNWIRLRGGPMDGVEMPWLNVVPYKEWPGWKAQTVFTFHDADEDRDCRYRNTGQIHPAPDGTRITWFDYEEGAC